MKANFKVNYGVKEKAQTPGGYVDVINYEIYDFCRMYTKEDIVWSIVNQIPELKKACGWHNAEVKAMDISAFFAGTDFLGINEYTHFSISAAFVASDKYYEVSCYTNMGLEVNTDIDSYGQRMYTVKTYTLDADKPEHKDLADVGDIVFTPRFCNVEISAVFADKDMARACGFTEPTFFIGNYKVFGKSIDVNHMIFAAVKK